MGACTSKKHMTSSVVIFAADPRSRSLPPTVRWKKNLFPGEFDNALCDIVEMRLGLGVGVHAQHQLIIRIRGKPLWYVFFNEKCVAENVVREWIRRQSAELAHMNDEQHQHEGDGQEEGRERGPRDAVVPMIFDRALEGRKVKRSFSWS